MTEHTYEGMYRLARVIEDFLNDEQEYRPLGPVQDEACEAIYQLRDLLNRLVMINPKPTYKLKVVETVEYEFKVETPDIYEWVTQHLADACSWAADARDVDQMQAIGVNTETLSLCVTEREWWEEE